MKGKGVSEGTDRRELLAHVLPAGALACLFCRRAFAATANQAKDAAPKPLRERSLEKCGMTYEELFRFAYGDGMIPVLKAMAADVGREKFLETLKKASCTAAERAVREELNKHPKNDFATFAAEFHKPNPLYDHTLTQCIVEETPTSIETRVTECLWARTWRDADAADIGYVAMCHPDVVAAPAYNPKMKLRLTKTLMQGDDCCNHRWAMET